MQEFLLSNYVLFTYSVEAMAAITGVLLYKKYKNSTTRYFIYFLVYLTICDFLSCYTWLVFPDKLFSFLVGTIIEKNYWWSTLYWKIGAIMFFAFFYRKILKTKHFKNIIKLTSYSFFIFSVGYILYNFEKFFITFFPLISVLGSIIIFLCAGFYFIEVLQSEKILTFYKSLTFYISATIFIWWLIITPIVFYDNYTTYEIAVYERDWDYIKLRRTIYLFSNIFMYSTFTFALIWCRPEADFEKIKNL
ncbi:hypothetical protein [Mariniflexile sp.]|uniref:hypothetical protein n=1 Tax=Mariniflexile sp. TaxID=1979402 RepID=UPI003565BB17